VVAAGPCQRGLGLDYTIPQLWLLATLELDGGRLEDARALYEEAIAASEEIASPMTLYWSGDGLVWVLLLQGELEEARLLSRKSLIGWRRLGRRRAAANALFQLACCATGTGDYHLAAKLTCAHDVVDADTTAAVPGATWLLPGAYKSTSAEQRVRDDNRGRLRQVLGEAEFERAYTVGRGLSFDEAANLALGRVRSA
jgi:hypothetical protein